MKIISTRGRVPSTALTQQQISEVARCYRDPIYFINTYIKIIHPTLGTTQLTLYPHQEFYVSNMMAHPQLITTMPRQAGATTVSVALLVWELIFESNKRTAIASRLQYLADHVRTLLSIMLRSLPSFLLPVILFDNKSVLELNNGNKVFFVNGANGLRGHTIDKLYLPDFAHFSNVEQANFWVAAAPALSMNARCIIHSTPMGVFDTFYKLWHDACNGINQFTALHIGLNDIPHWSPVYLANIRNTIGELDWRREYECEFI